LVPAVGATGMTALFLHWHDIPFLESEFWDGVQGRSWEGCKALVGDWAIAVLVVRVVAAGQTPTDRGSISNIIRLDLPFGSSELDASPFLTSLFAELATFHVLSITWRRKRSQHSLRNHSWEHVAKLKEILNAWCSCWVEALGSNQIGLWDARFAAITYRCRV